MNAPAQPSDGGGKVVTRPAGLADCRRVFEWANDPETRKASFFDASIPLADHERWYADSLDGDRRILRIAEVDATPVGLIRFDRDAKDPKTAEIGINMAPKHRDRGLAAPVLLAARRDAATLGIRRLVARIRTENRRSIRAFERAEFVFVGAARVRGSDAARYEIILD